MEEETELEEMKDRHGVVYPLAGGRSMSSKKKANPDNDERRYRFWSVM